MLGCLSALFLALGPPAPTGVPLWLLIPVALAMIAVLLIARGMIKERDLAVQEEGKRIRVLQGEVAELSNELTQLRQDHSLKTHTSETYFKIATMGISGCGKTALTIKWTNPTAKIDDKLPPTKFAEYNKPISFLRREDGTRVIHFFTIFDRGGEFGPEVIDLLVKDKMDALLLVVDLAISEEAADKQAFSEERIAKQLEEFNRSAVQYLFTPSITETCKHYVLFINKVDAMQRKFRLSPEELEAKAKEYFQPLIDSLSLYASKKIVKFVVLTGSATSGSGTNALYDCMINGILPADAKDDALKLIPKGHDQRSEAPLPAKVKLS